MQNDGGQTSNSPKYGETRNEDGDVESTVKEGDNAKMPLGRSINVSIKQTHQQQWQSGKTENDVDDMRQ